MLSLTRTILFAPFIPFVALFCHVLETGDLTTSPEFTPSYTRSSPHATTPTPSQNTTPYSKSSTTSPRDTLN